MPGDQRGGPGWKCRSGSHQKSDGILIPREGEVHLGRTWREIGDSESELYETHNEGTELVKGQGRSLSGQVCKPVTIPSLSPFPTVLCLVVSTAGGKY